MPSSSTAPEKSQPESLSQYAQIAILFAGIILLAVYFLFRYQGHWGENDTGFFTRSIAEVTRTGQIAGLENSYSNGYGYPTLGAFLVQISGVTPSQLQSVVSVLLAFWVILPAWLLYREFTASNNIATLAVVILMVQPELLFSLLRGTHEKFTRGLMLFCLFLLLRSLRSRKKMARFAAYIIAFYLVAYAMVTFNNLLAFSFIVAVVVALLLSWSGLRGKLAMFRNGHPIMQRMVIIFLSMLVIAFLFTFYAYPPAQAQLSLMESMTDRMASMFLQVESTTTNPYAVVQFGWIAPQVYLLVSLANWLLLAVSAVLWLKESYLIFRKGQRLPENEMLLWAFYGAFGLMGFVSVFVDISGAVSSNLQHRIFPAFAVLAAPLVAKWAVRWQPNASWAGRLARVALWGGMGILAVLSIIKATNEPLLSNNWIFYRPSEMIALGWANDFHQDSGIWIDFNERLHTSFDIQEGQLSNGNFLDEFSPDSGTTTFLTSIITRLRSERLGLPLPMQPDSLKIYDNGETAIYRNQPISPYQK